MQTGRMFELVYLLLERGSMTAGELAARFEVSERTIRRDVDALSAAGIPVYTSRGRGGGVALLPGFVLDKSLLSQREQDEILFALQGLRAAGVDADGRVLERLSTLFHRGGEDWLAVDFSPWGSSEGDRALFPTLKQAILERRVVAFDYYASDGRASHRLVEPRQLRFKGAAWYLQGWCRSRAAWRTFRLSRMVCITLLPETFSPRSGPLPPLDEAGEDTPMLEVQLRFSPAAAYRVYDEFSPAAVQPLENGELAVSFSWPAGAWGVGYLLSFGGEVEVLAPAGLRRELALQAQKILDRCGKAEMPCPLSCGMLGASQERMCSNMKESETRPMHFCQSCGMPLSGPGDHGTEVDGAPSADYCTYCYQKGAFTRDCSMEEMADFCLTVPANQALMKGKSPQEAKELMMAFFSTLKRWK